MKDVKESLLTNDLVFKKVFTSEENRHLLKKLIETILEIKFESVTSQETYHIDTYQRYHDQDELMRTEVDILATTSTGEKITIELQVQNHQFFVERTVYYAIEAYRSNYGNQTVKAMEQGNNYSALRKTYGINIVDFDLFGEESETIRTFELMDRKNHEPLAVALNVNLFSVTYFSLKNKHIDVGSDLYHLQQLIGTGKVSQEAPAFMLEIQRKADYHNLSRRERKMVNQIEKERDIRNAQLSSSRLEGIAIGERQGLEQGLERGLEQGLERGLERGEELGRNKERVAFSKKLMVKGYELEEIQELTGISLDELVIIQKESD